MYTCKKNSTHFSRKMSASVLTFLVFCLYPIAGSCFEQHNTHVHGVAELNVAIDGHEIVLELISPAANIVGFEHIPANSEDRKKVKQAVSMLKDGKALFRFPEAAGCKLESVDVDGELVEHDIHEHNLPEKHHDSDHNHNDIHHEHHSEHGGKHSKEHAHSDFHAEYKFHIGTPEKLKGFEVLLLEKFPGIEHLEVQLLSPAGQTGVELTGDNKLIAW